MFAGALLAVIAAAPPPQVSLAVTGLNAIDVPAARAAFYTEHFATELISPDLRIVTEREVATLLGIDRQKQLAGCSESIRADEGEYIVGAASSENHTVNSAYS